VLLTVLATVLFVGAVRIIGAVFGEAGLGPGETMDAARRRRSRIAMAIAAPVILLGLWGGKKWWDFDEKEYRTQTLYQASQMTAGVIVRTNQNVLELALDQENERNQSRRLMPDHGKLMHLFLIREPGLDVFAHLHPLKRSWEDFEVGLPPLPPGRYCAYADITRENGLAETLTATVELPNPSPKMMALWQEESSDQICGNGVVRVAPPEGSPLLPDADDTWHVNHKSTVAVSTNVVPVSGGLTMAWLREGNLVQNRELSLRFQLLGTNGQPEALETYIGMFGHAAIRRDDGAVFAHIHPSGTYSMAAQEYFGGGESPEEPAKSSAPIREVSFPFAFPKPGPYHLWVQVKAHGRVYTGLFLPVVQ